jgi:tetratricopeptide (TPR) repeat protein
MCLLNCGLVCSGISNCMNAMKSIHLYLNLMLFCCLGTNASAQSSREIDSLNSLLRMNLPDSQKVNVYANLSWLYAGNREKTGIARKYADSILMLSETAGYSRGIALSHFYYGIADRFEANFDEGMNHFRQFINYQVKQGDSSRVATGLFQMGAICLQLGEYEKGLTNLFRALSIYESTNDISGKQFILTAIGTVYKAAKKYEEAISVYKQVLETDSLYADAMMNLGNIYMELDKLDTAIGWYRKALHIDRQNGADWAVAYDLENIGTSFLKSGRYDSALVYHLESLRIRNRLPGKLEQCISLSQTGITYVFLRNFRMAENYLFHALDLAEELRSITLRRDIYEKFSILYEEKQDIRNALQYFKKYVSLKDSLLNEENIKQINILKARFETAEKDRQIVLLSKEREVQEKETQRQTVVKRAFIGGFILMTLIAGMAYQSFSQKLKTQKILSIKNDEIREANFRRQLSELEMKALQAQINPHFIFNCLNSINQMIMNGESEIASGYLAKFSRLIRQILENAENMEVPLKDELSLLEAYLQLEKLRFNSEILFRIRVSDEIDPENTYLPSMVLQPFVENAIWHGLLPKRESGEGFISIDIHRKDGNLVCLIEDNGIGREKALELSRKSVYPKKSLGLKITEERLKLLNNKFHQQLVRITDLKDTVGKALGTRVEVFIPSV